MRTHKLLIAASLTALASPALAQSNQSSVNQTGSGAAATVTQNGANDRSTVSQASGGTVTVKQTGITGSTSTVTTSADDRPPDSTVTVTQSDTGGANTAIGQANVSTVVQDNVNGFGASGTGSTVAVSQRHEWNGAGQNSSSVQQGRNAVSGQVSVTQRGGDNTSLYSSFTSTDNDAVIRQTGRNNYSDVQQDFQNGAARADVNQANLAGGATNSGTIDQLSAGFSESPAEFAVGADAFIVQFGSGNSSTISQTGYSADNSTSNFASNGQIGTGNSSTITQPGVDNFAIVIQQSNGSSSLVSQGGDDNNALVTQTASANVSTVLQGGNNNTAAVGQTSSSNSSFVDQSGSNNFASVIQGSN